MTKSKKAKFITVEFYRLSVSGAGSATFADLFDPISKLPLPQRIYPIDDIPIWLLDFKVADQFIQGDMVRLRMTDLPNKGKLSGDIEDLNLQDDEGISEQSAFFYHKETRVLLFQKVKEGIDIGQFCNYFSEHSGSTGIVIDEPILEADAMRKFESFKEIRQFDLKVANLEGIEIHEDPDAAVEELLDINKELNSSTMEITFSVERQKNKFLKKIKVFRMANDLVKRYTSHKSAVRKLKVGGISDQDKYMFLDLLGTRMKEKIRVNYSEDERNRSIPFDARIDAIKELWAEKQAELFKMFKT